MTRELLFCTAFLFFSACSNQTNEKEQTEIICFPDSPATVYQQGDNELIKLGGSFATVIPFDKLNIPKHWTEIKKQSSEWTYTIPCHNFRELQTVDIFNENNIPKISCNFGTDGQWFTIKKIYQHADSLVFSTVLPYDTSSTVIILMQYIDEGKNITRWTADGVVCTYIPTADTIKYKRITEMCD